MKTVSVIFRCKICKHGMKLTIPKPKLVTQSYFTRTCSGCNTDYQFKANLKAGSGGKVVDFESSFLARPTRWTGEVEGA